jgi:hypothetical protein
MANAAHQIKSGAKALLEGLTTEAGYTLRQVSIDQPVLTPSAGTQTAPAEAWIEVDGFGQLDPSGGHAGVVVTPWSISVYVAIYWQQDAALMNALTTQFAVGVRDLFTAHARGGVNPSTGIIVRMVTVDSCEVVTLADDGGIAWRELRFRLTYYERAAVTVTDP